VLPFTNDTSIAIVSVDGQVSCYLATFV
jgi:hypothetical protein